MLKLFVVLACFYPAFAQECKICPMGVCNRDTRCPVNENPIIPHKDCGKFYQCSNGFACEMSCPAGLHWSVSESRCEWPHIACCDPSVECRPCCDTTPTTTTVIPTTPTTAITTPTTVVTTPTTVVTTPTMAPTTPSPTPTPSPSTVVTPDDSLCIYDSRCPVNDNPMNPLLLPHESDCTLFYKCDHGKRCPMECRPGEHFSNALQRCEWPNIACCDPRIPCSTTPITTTTVTPTTVTTTGPGSDSCVADSRCPANDNPMNPLLLPHESDCTLFYKCDFGQRCQMQCRPGEHFSNALQRCEWPNIACCDPRIPCSETTVTTTTSTTPGPATGTCTPDSRCPANDNPMNPLMLPHESDCTRFYKCDFGQRCLMECRPGEHFSSSLQRCEWPNYACCDSRIPCQTIPNINDPCYPEVCPIPVCYSDSGCPLTDNPLIPIHLRNPASCSSFYKCLQGKACLVECPSGQHWSQYLQRCEWPNVACCSPTVQCCAQCVADRRRELARLFGIKKYN
ncbi:mucin-2-like [Topomyia yanbarensis]|uniref:mucin-2-like n=1 Tax=Topomyia yanbarensis TaxID=2498891 RepID=UPI00273BD2D8|nr:mucin-2-like [Topomyia yanbarensis]